MSGYLARLMHQTGIEVPGAIAPTPIATPGTSCADAQVSSSALRAVEIDQFVRQPEADRGLSPVVSRTEAAQNSQTRATEFESPAAAHSKRPSGDTLERTMQPGAGHTDQSADVPDGPFVLYREVVASHGATPPFNSTGADSALPFPGVTNSASARPFEKGPEAGPWSAVPIVEMGTIETAAGPPSAVARSAGTVEPKRSRREILEAVREWVAAPPIEAEERRALGAAGSPRTHSVLNQGAGNVPVRMPGTEAILRAVTPAPELTLAIGTISVTIEGPAPTLAPSSPPARTESRSDTGNTDRLRFRRHYLRQ